MLTTSAAIIIIAAGIKLAAPLLVPLLIALFIAIVTAPIVIWLCDRGWPRALAVAAGLLIDAAAAVALGFPLATAITTFSERVPDYASQLSGRMTEIEAWLVGRGINIESVFNFEEAAWLVDLATSMAQTAASIVSQMVLVLLIVAFMLFESTGIREKLGRTFKPDRIAILSESVREVNTYLVAKTIMSLITGIIVYVWCWSQGLDVPLLWGLLAYLLNFIPTIGQIIAAVPAILLALIQFGPVPAFVVAIGYGFINLFIGAVEPRVMGQALGLSALVVLLSMVIWGWLLGPVGALLSAPLTLLIKHAMAQSDDLRWAAALLDPSPKPTAGDSLPPVTGSPHADAATERAS